MPTKFQSLLVKLHSAWILTGVFIYFEMDEQLFKYLLKLRLGIWW